MSFAMPVYVCVCVSVGGVCKHAHKSIKLLRDFVLLDFQ